MFIVMSYTSANNQKRLKLPLPSHNNRLLFRTSCLFYFIFLINSVSWTFLLRSLLFPCNHLDPLIS